MAAKNFYAGNKNFKLIHDSLIIKYDSETVARIIAQAGKEYDSIVAAHEGDPKKQLLHVKNAAALLAIYKVLKQETPEDALEIVAEQSNSQALEGRKRFLKYTNAAPRLFILACRMTAKSMYSEDAGFKTSTPQCKKNEMRINIEQCPYVKICQEHECPELAKVFCDRDVYAYAHLPKVNFQRSGTLAQGAQCCDFSYSLREQNRRTKA